MPIPIRNIVFECPDERALAAFYAELLGMQVIREDWLVIAHDREDLPRLAFDTVPDYRPPRWPDPAHPQQVHLDLSVPDLTAAEQLALRLGARRLQVSGTFRSYAAPAGHPFCLYHDPGTPTGRVGRVVFDCADPRAAADFYQQLLGMPARPVDSPERIVIAPADDRQPALRFQPTSAEPPRWPDPAYPQQLHLDLDVTDGAAAGEQALQLGATRLPDLGGSCPVYADPAGHPLCLCAPGQ